MFAKKNAEKCKITLNEMVNLKENERVFKPIGLSIFIAGKMFILKEKT